jgi:MFS family permease
MALYIHGAAHSYLFGVLVLPMEKDLGWSRSLLVGALTVSTLTGAAVGIVAGPLIDRHGARVAMTVSAALGGIILLLLSQVDAPWQFYLLLGVGMGATRTGVESLAPRTVIANWFVRRRAAAFTWYSGGRAMFGVTAVAPMAYLVTETSWRAAWALLGTVELFVLVPLAWIIIRRRPEDYGQLPDGDAAPPPQPVGAPPVALASDEHQWTRGEAMRTPTFWMLAMAFVLTGFPAAGIIANMLPYFEDRGLSFTTGSWAFSVFGVGALLGRPVWGYVAGRYGVGAGLTAYGFAYGFSILGFVIAPNMPLLFLAALPLGITTGGAMQLQAQAWPDYFGRGHVGAITGVAILAVTPAMAAGPLVAALAFDLLGSYTVVFTVYGLVTLVSGALFYLARRPSVAPAKAGARP